MKLECISLQDRASVPISEASILCLGNFDGVHLGHRALLARARALRDSRYPTAACGVFCFKTLPSRTLSQEPPRLLCTAEQRLDAFAAAGMDFVILADFDELRALSPEDFATLVLQDACHCVTAVCGFNYRFGKNAEGTPALLSSLMKGRAEIVDAVEIGGAAVSSTRIRALLAEGSVTEAARLLGSPYRLCAPVEHGKALGRVHGVPTLNQPIPDELQPVARGVYVTDCEIDGRLYRGVTNVGTHPTVDRNAPLNCETHLLDFSGDLYEKQVAISFLAYLREERRFDSTEALYRQIASDIAAARRF